MSKAIEAIEVSKNYGPLKAVDHTDFTLLTQEIHVLLGTNGCGKSTLCKMIAGAVQRDSGEIILHGKSANLRNPLDARQMGVATVYQELSLNPTQTVAANIFLGNELVSTAAMLDGKQMNKQAAQLIASVGELGNGLHPEDIVGDLSIDKRQIVEIIKALALKPSIILFDESTSSLDKNQVSAFFDLVRRLRDEGASIIFISHRMGEILEIGERVTVMRNGRCMPAKKVAETNRVELVEMMVGQEGLSTELTEPVQEKLPVVTDTLDKFLIIQDISGDNLAPISFDLRAGEVLGLGGLHGQGQSNLLRLIFGRLTRETGSIQLNDQDLPPNSPLASIRAGIAYVSGDRARDGSLHGRSILENMSLSGLTSGDKGLFSVKSLLKQVGKMGESLGLKHGGLKSEIGTLSGGNQQKVIIGRALSIAPKILLLDDPTKGIDVNAKRDLFKLIRELCAKGTAVILYSSEDGELLEHSDKIFVFNGGCMVEQLEGERLTEFELYSAALRSSS